MKIAVTGSKGRLGSALVQKYGYYPLSVDITNREELFDTVSIIAPDVIVHCAALTDVNACEIDVAKTVAVNYRGTLNVRESFRGRLIHLSTDFVFQGKRGPYSEYSIDGYPIQKYGWSKYGAEQIIKMYQDEFPADTIVRTTNLYGSGAKLDFLSTVFYAGKTWKESSDVMCTPTYVYHLAEAIHWLVGCPPRIPIIHLAGATTLSRYEAVKQFIETFNISIELQKGVYTGSVPRGKKGGLNCSYASQKGAPIYAYSDGLQAWKETMNA